MLAAYSVGMPALFVDRIVSASFLSRGDTATPMKVTLVGVALNVLLKIALYKPLGAPGLALATAAGLWVKVAGVYALARRPRLDGAGRAFHRHRRRDPVRLRRAGAGADARGRSARLGALASAALRPRDAAPDPDDHRRCRLFSGAGGRNVARRRGAQGYFRPDAKRAGARAIAAEVEATGDGA